MLAARRAGDEQVTAQDLAVSSVLHLTRMKTLSVVFRHLTRGRSAQTPVIVGHPLVFT